MTSAPTQRETVSVVWDRNGKFFQSWTSSYNGDGMQHAEKVAANIGGTFKHITSED